MSPYITHNHWFLLFFITTPLIVFAGWRSIGWAVFRCGVAGWVGWVLIQWAVDRHWALRVAFLPADATAAQRMDATADGASRVFYAILGWVPAGFYVLIWFCFWLALWWFRQRRRNGPVSKDTRAT